MGKLESLPAISKTMGDDEDNVKGMGEAKKQAEAGMALFKKDEELQLDTDAAQKFKDAADADIKKIMDEAEALTGKDNKKARKAKEKEASDKKVAKEYIDALKVLKGVKPPNGNFLKTSAAQP